MISKIILSYLKNQCDKLRLLKFQNLGNIIGMQELFPRNPNKLATYSDGQYRCNENEMYTFFCENLIPAYNQVKNKLEIKQIF